MNLTLFFRLILMSIFQTGVTSGKKSYFDTAMSYSNQFFFCPKIIAKDGFSMSCQIHNGNYCSSENGYRIFGHTIKTVEWGFPNQNEELLASSAESPENITESVGSISIEKLEQIFEKHGGIDWEATISIQAFERLVKS